MAVLKKNPLPSQKKRDLKDIESNELVKKILEETISLYGIYDAWVLRQKTHNESPWTETPHEKTISDEKMISFFKKLPI